ncbi:MAG: TIGR02266 family protein [Myxococcales bacterium]|nr:TIGR02266 family protein [Myxococcales bacterium]
MDARFCGVCGFRMAMISSETYQALATDKRKTGAPIALVPDALARAATVPRSAPVPRPAPVPQAAPAGSTAAPIPLTNVKSKPGGPVPRQSAQADAARRPETNRRFGDAASEARTDFRGVHAPATKHDTSRTSKRFPLKVEVDYGSEHNFYTGFLENISSGGLFIATHQLRDIGDVLDVQFTVPGLSRPITATVKVRWLREYNPSSDAPPGMGCQFGPLEPDAKAAIELFLKHRDPLFFDD